jgi:hypothetical protein
MSTARKLLLITGVVLALWGMSWGLFYAVFVEHQTLDALGGEITTGFVRAAERKLPLAHESLAAYARTEFKYVRQVDVHSHWLGLAMLLIVLGLVFDRIRLRERGRVLLAGMLAVGSTVFPLGVILQTAMSGPVPSALAILGAALVSAGLAGSAWGFARPDGLRRAHLQ